MTTKRICMLALGVALFVALSLCLQVPVFENYYLCLGYVVMTVFCYCFGPGSGMIVGGLGVVLYCMVTGGMRGMPGWAAGNLLIGLIVGMCCKLTLKMGSKWMRYILIGISVVLSAGIGILMVKSLVETILYAQPMILRLAKNLYAFVADAFVMIFSLPICVGIRKVISKSFADEMMS